MYRLYRQANFSVRWHKKCKRPVNERMPQQLEQTVSEVWSMDFSIVSAPKPQAQPGGLERLAFIYSACRGNTQDAPGLHEEAARLSPD